MLEKGSNISFLASGFDFINESKDYWSGGMYATHHNHPEVLSLILRCKVDPFIKNEKLRSIKTLADELGDERILTMINAPNRMIVGMEDPGFPVIDLSQAKDIVTILYHSAWREVARDVGQELMKQGKTVFLDEGQYSDEDAKARLDKALDLSKIVIVICSESAGRDLDCQREITLASDKRKSVVSLVPHHLEDGPESWKDNFPLKGTLGAVLAPFPYVLLPLQPHQKTQSRRVLANREDFYSRLITTLSST